MNKEDENENEVEGQINAFSAIREIHKKGETFQLPEGYDPSKGKVFRINRTPEEQAEYEKQLQREAVLYSHAARGLQFKSKKPKGSITKLTQYIHQLATDNLDKTAKELLQLEGVRKEIGKMADRTFANHVTKARKAKT